jgi:cathepsin L
LNSHIVSVGIVADHIMNYRGGIFSGYCGGRVDHAVNVVGYASNYWKLRNSWGTGWGESGYFRFDRGSDRCSITAMINWPLL